MSGAETTLVIMAVGYATHCLMELIMYLDGGYHDRERRDHARRRRAEGR